MDLGTVKLDSTLVGAFVVTDSAGTPKDPTSLPTYRVYGQSSSLMPNGQGNAAKLDTGAITNATNASPVVITSAGHGLTTGTRVSVSSVGGNTAANTETTITRIDNSTFSLDGVVGNGAYTGGGSWHVSGLYTVSILAAGGDGYEAGQTYFVLASWSLGGVNYGACMSFTVV